MVRKMTEIKYVKEVEVDVHDIEIEKSWRDSRLVERVVFKTNIGNITFKPGKSIEKHSSSQGFTIKRRERQLVSIEELPRKLWDLNMKLQKGMCKIKLSYFLWQKIVDEKIIPIRFLRDNQVKIIQFLGIEEKVG